MNRTFLYVKYSFLWALALIVCSLALNAAVVSGELQDGPDKPKNIILMIGDGMGLPQIALMQYRLKNGTPFYLDSFQVVGLQKTHSLSHIITDSGAAATAMSTGNKTYNNAIGVGPDTLPRENLMELAEQKGIHTGVIVTSSVINATPAGFVCHQTFRGFSEEIALDFLYHDIDVIIGGGKDYFDKRYTDDRNLVEEMEAKGYNVQTYYGKHFAEKLSDVEEEKVVIFTGKRDPVQRNQGRDYFPFAVEATMEYLAKREKGFFVMAEGSQIDFAGHRTNGEYLIYELLDFHDAIRNAYQFAKTNKETLVLVTADHECGGLYFEKGKPSNKPVFSFQRNKHTAQMVPVFAFGPGSEMFNGIYDNTEIYHKIKHLLDL
jgi:alkaline phosphatase